MMLRHAADAVLAALVAPPCAGCGRVLDHPLDGPVCDACWTSVSPLPPDMFPLHGISIAYAVGQYGGTLRAVLHALKYDGRRSIARGLSALMAAHGRHVLEGADAVVPVPLHRRRERQRGFNQSEDLARGLGLPVRRVLRRVRETAPQVDLPADRRRENVHGAFAVASPRGWRPFGRAPFDVCGRVIVLVDDVATTGATLEACARALRAAGPADVRALTAARVVTGRH